MLRLLTSQHADRQSTLILTPPPGVSVVSSFRFLVVTSPFTVESISVMVEWTSGWS